MFDISSRDMGALKEAMIYHSDGYTDHDDITVKVCWDADRLDLSRVGITPNPKKMCTATAKKFYHVSGNQWIFLPVSLMLMTRPTSVGLSFFI